MRERNRNGLSTVLSKEIDKSKMHKAGIGQSLTSTMNLDDYRMLVSPCYNYIMEIIPSIDIWEVDGESMDKVKARRSTVPPVVGLIYCSNDTELVYLACFCGR